MSRCFTHFGKRLGWFAVFAGVIALNTCNRGGGGGSSSTPVSPTPKPTNLQGANFGFTGSLDWSNADSDRNGYFTKALIDGLNGVAVFQKRGRVTSRQIDAYLTDEVSR
jgi:hypothetical protein